MLTIITTVPRKIILKITHVQQTTQYLLVLPEKQTKWLPSQHTHLDEFQLKRKSVAIQEGNNPSASLMVLLRAKTKNHHKVLEAMYIHRF